MRLQTVPALRGISWIKRGFAAFRMRPIGFASLFASFLFGCLLLVLVPLIGPVVLTVLLPTVTLVFMTATRRVMEGGMPTPMLFAELWHAPKSRRLSLLWLGVIYAIATIAVVALGDLLDGGAFEALSDAIPTDQNPSEVMAERLSVPGMAAGVLLRFSLAGLLSLPFWHAPALVYWKGHRCAQALFTSTLTCIRNFGAFLVFGLAWIALIFAVGVAANILFTLIGAPQLFAMIGAPLSLLLTTVFYASLYFTYVDCFADDQPLAISNTPASSAEDVL